MHPCCASFTESNLPTIISSRCPGKRQQDFRYTRSRFNRPRSRIVSRDIPHVTPRILRRVFFYYSPLRHAYIPVCIIAEGVTEFEAREGVYGRIPVAKLRHNFSFHSEISSSQRLLRFFRVLRLHSFPKSGHTVCILHSHRLAFSFIRLR